MFGHPAGLKTLFFTELWERLSYYGMRALLVLFLVGAIETGGFGMTSEKAGAIYGLYTAMVYLCALPGGWIADRILGLRQSVFVGGVIIAAGHFSMAIPSVSTFYFGLVLIVIGTGLLKPNISALVGELYPEGGGRRDAGFSLYYMGINLGAFLGPLVCGYLGQKHSWHLGFSAAGIGTVFGLIQYRMGLKNLGDAGAVSVDPAVRASSIRQFGFGLGGLVSVIAIATALQLMGVIGLTVGLVAQGLGLFIALVAILYFAYILVLGNWSLVEKKRIVVIFFLFLSSAMFWAGFEQAGSSMNLFADRLTNLSIMGWEFPSTYFQSVNPFFIIILAPGFAWVWVWLKHREPSIPVKFGIALLLMSGGFLLIGWGATYATEATKVSPIWLIMTYLLHTTGELCLSPVGLSSVTKLAPKALVGQMMGMWFTGTALGNLIAGLSGGLFDSLPLPQLFGTVAAFGVVFGIVLIVFKGPITKLCGGVK